MIIVMLAETLNVFMLKPMTRSCAKSQESLVDLLPDIKSGRMSPESIKFSE